MGAVALGEQRGEFRQLVVAFDQRGARADACDQPRIQRPDCGRDRRIVRIDQQRASEVRVGRVPGEVDFRHRIAGKGIEVGRGRIAEIVRADIDVVDVEEQAATGAARELGEKIGFVPRMPVDTQIVRGIFDGDAPAERILRAGDIFGNALQRFGGARKRQQVRLVGAAPAAPGEVFRYQPGLDPLGERREAREMASVGGCVGGERQRDAVQ